MINLTNHPFPTDDSQHALNISDVQDNTHNSYTNLGGGGIKENIGDPLLQAVVWVETL